MPDRFRTADWEDLRFFLALARHRTLSAAARALKVNHATVSRRLARLEATLAVPLFDRRPDGYGLTADGQAVLAEAAAMEEAALAALKRLDRRDGLSGLVRLTTTRGFADSFLANRLAPLLAAHPGIDIEIVTDSRLLSLARREADIALRFGSPRDSALKGKRVAMIGCGFFAAPLWRDRLAAGAAPVLVTFDGDSAFIPEAAWLADTFGGYRAALRSNSWQVQAAAARDGFGIAFLPNYLAVATPGLVAVDLGATLPPRELWMLIRPDLAAVPRVRAVSDVLDTLFRENRDLLAGTAGIPDRD